MPGPWPPGRDGADFLWTLCDFLERSDIDSIWLSDRLSSPVPVPEVMTTLAAVAARTDTAQVRPQRDRAAVSHAGGGGQGDGDVDWLSQGRLFPAVGRRRGAAARVRGLRACPFTERGRRTDEAIHVIRLLWTQDEVTLPGRVLQARPDLGLPQAVADARRRSGSAARARPPSSGPRGSATAGSRPSSRRTSSAPGSEACRSWRRRRGARCPRITSAP